MLLLPNPCLPRADIQLCWLCLAAVADYVISDDVILSLDPEQITNSRTWLWGHLWQACRARDLCTCYLSKGDLLELLQTHVQRSSASLAYGRDARRIPGASRPQVHAAGACCDAMK